MQTRYSSQQTVQQCNKCGSHYVTAIPRRFTCIQCQPVNKVELAGLMDYAGPHIVVRWADGVVNKVS